MALGSGSGGSRTLGRYELIAEVAKGQLGALWAAHSPESEDSSVVMIRRVPTSAPVTPDEIDHLSEGAWWSLEVQHPTLARAADVVMTDGELGIVMPYAEGEVLRSLLLLSSFKRKAIPVPVALKIALEVLDAVHQADTQAMPHTGGGSSYGLGGLVPDSVLVCRNGSVRLLDFGVAGPATKVGPLSRHPEMAAYASPEQLDGETLDLRANLYAVGVMLWEMLAGKRLYVGSTHSAVSDKVKAGTTQRVDATKPVGGDDIPSSVADVVEKAISPSRDERYQSVEEMVEALRGAADVATVEDVAKLVEDLAGNTLSTRQKVIDRATGAAKSASRPERKSIADRAPPARPKPPAPAAAPPPPQGGRKATLLGIAPVGGGAPVPPPPPPRQKMESLDSELLEIVAPSDPPPGGEEDIEVKSLMPEDLVSVRSPSVPEVLEPPKAVEPPPKPPEASPKPPEASPKPPEASPKPPEASPKPPEASPKPPEAKDETREHLKTQMLGSPTPTAEAVEEPAASEDEPAPISLQIAIESDEPEVADEPPKLMDVLKASPAPEPEAKKETEKATASESAKEPEKKPAQKDEAKESEEKDEKSSAVAWIAPPGASLDDAPPRKDKDAEDKAEARADDDEDEEPMPPSIVDERTQKARRYVFGIVGGAAALLLIAVVASALKGGDEKPKGEEKPATSAAATTKPEPSAAPAPSPAPTPSATVEEEKTEPEEDAGAVEEEKTEPEEEKPVAETPKPKPVYNPKPRPRPKPKPKPFVPKGI